MQGKAVEVIHLRLVAKDNTHISSWMVVVSNDHFSTLNGAAGNTF
jgi:tryptophanase